MPIRYDAIIFDVDGTLWNASEASAKGWNNVLAQLGLDQRVTAQQIENVAGNPLPTCIDLLLPGLRSNYPALMDAFSASEKDVLSTEGGTLYDGVIDGIKEIVRDRPVFIVSNCQESYMELFLDFSGLSSVVKGVDCYGLSGVSKGQMLSNLKSKFFVTEPLYIGDTAGDEAAAHQANCDFIHAAYGFGAPTQPGRSVASFGELLALLRS